MASRTARKDTSRYKIRNWKQYEAGLIQRGSISFWINDDAIDQGICAPMPGSSYTSYFFPCNTLWYCLIYKIGEYF